MEISENDVIIVGSRCGGFDYYARKKNEESLIWLGAEKFSDLDIYSKPSSPSRNQPYAIDCKNIKRFKLPTIKYKYEFPFQLNGKLYLPEDKSYLCWAINKKLKLSHQARLKMKGQIFEIFDKDKKFLFDISFVPISQFWGAQNSFP